MFRKEAKFMLSMFALLFMLALLIALIAPQLVRVSEKALEKVKQMKQEDEAKAKLTFRPAP